MSEVKSEIKFRYLKKSPYKNIFCCCMLLWFISFALMFLSLTYVLAIDATVFLSQNLWQENFFLAIGTLMGSMLLAAICVRLILPFIIRTMNDYMAIAFFYNDRVDIYFDTQKIQLPYKNIEIIDYGIKPDEKSFFGNFDNLVIKTGKNNIIISASFKESWENKGKNKKASLKRFYEELVFKTEFSSYNF